MNSYKAAIEYLYDRLPVFHHVGGAAYKPGLDNTVKLMNVLDNPHCKFKCIHVAGTNGKGSVSNMLSAIFQSAGYKTGLYTSPHLVDFAERIRINGEMIDQSYVVDFVKQQQTALETIQPSFFEATMAMAFNYFADKQVDIAIVEVGLGGRLDSTNVVDPILSVITNISFDHVAFLGDTLEKIAIEKAGIIKLLRPVVIGEWLPETKSVFEQKALEMNAPIYFANQNLVLSSTNNGLLHVTDGTTTYKLDLCGEYQLKNLATVLKVVEVFITLESVTNMQLQINDVLVGLEHVTKLTGLQGRWQLLKSSPNIIADTGHNLAGIEYVVQQLKKENYQHLHIIIGFANDKDISYILNILPQNARYYFTQAQINRALAANELQKIALESGLIGNQYNTIAEALKVATENASTNDLIFIGGSNFVVGEAIELINSNL